MGKKKNPDICFLVRWCLLKQEIAKQEAFCKGDWWIFYLTNPTYLEWQEKCQKNVCEGGKEGEGGGLETRKSDHGQAEFSTPFCVSW